MVWSAALGLIFTIKHAAAHNRCKAKIHWLNTEDIEKKGIAVLSVNEMEGHQTVSLIELLLAKATSPRIFLTGMPLIDSQECPVLLEIQRRLEPYNPFFEIQEKCGDTLIYNKDFVLTSSEARIIPRNERGSYDPENIIVIPYD